MRTVGMGAEKKLDALEKLKAEKEALLKENEELRKAAKTKSAKTKEEGRNGVYRLGVVQQPLPFGRNDRG